MSPAGNNTAKSRRSPFLAATPFLVTAAGLLILTACTSHTSGAGTHSGSISKSVPTTSTAATDTPTGPTSPESLTASASTSPTNSQSTIQQTNLVITRSGWNAGTHTASAVAILPGKVIDTGSCTFTLTLGTVTRSVSKPTTPDASSTDCGLLAITDTTLTPGTWSGSVSFTGGGMTARSATFPMQVTA